MFFRSRKVRLPNGLTILTPPGHRLKEYQEVHPRYDRFLGELAAVLPPESVVIDIGANVGDSVALMGSSNPNLKILCVEPDAFFLRYLAKNVKRLLRSGFRGTIEVVQSFAGTSKTGCLVGDATTKVFESVDGGPPLPFSTLKELATLALGVFKSPRIELIKIDVDGYDWEVLDSGMDFVAQDNPLIFFEALCLDRKGLTGLAATVENLSALHYSFALFDNFGNFVIESNEHRVINQLVSYTFSPHLASSIPINYFDVLAAPAELMPPLLSRLGLRP
jgi:FkbM family methyltransferase